MTAMSAKISLMNPTRKNSAVTFIPSRITCGKRDPCGRDQAPGNYDVRLLLGPDIWAQSGEKMLKARQRVSAKFREKLRSPMPLKKKIRLGIIQTRIFENGEVIAVLLRTAGKNYSMNYEKPMSEEEYHALDGKYVLMQLIDCPSN